MEFQCNEGDAKTSGGVTLRAGEASNLLGYVIRVAVDVDGSTRVAHLGRNDAKALAAWILAHVS